MNRVLSVVSSLLFLACGCCFAQTPAPSDPQALALVAKAITALTGGLTVGGVTLNANAISLAGSDYFTGTATLQATDTTSSRFDLDVNDATRSEIRVLSNGFPSGTWISPAGKSQPLAQHNCWTDPVWFFPALSSLTQTTNAAYFFSYIGQEQHDSLTVNHIRVFQHYLWDQTNLNTVDRLSAMDIYLDPTSSLPLAVAFATHPDADMKVDIPVEIRFANYRLVSGVQVPYHIQRLLNGGIALDLTVTSAVLNSTTSATSNKAR